MKSPLAFNDGLLFCRACPKSLVLCNAHDWGNDMAAKILAFVLRGSGLLMLTALIAVAMPFAWMQEIHKGYLGLGDMPGVFDSMSSRPI